MTLAELEAELAADLEEEPTWALPPELREYRCTRLGVWLMGSLLGRVCCCALHLAAALIQLAGHNQGVINASCSTAVHGMAWGGAGGVVFARSK